MPSFWSQTKALLSYLQITIILRFTERNKKNNMSPATQFEYSWDYGKMNVEIVLVNV